MARNGKLDAFNRWMRKCSALEDLLTSGAMSSDIDQGKSVFRVMFRTGGSMSTLWLGDQPLRMGGANHLVVIAAERFVPRRVIEDETTHPEKELIVDGAPVGWAVHLPDSAEGGRQSYSMTMPSLVAAVMYAMLVLGDK